MAAATGLPRLSTPHIPSPVGGSRCPTQHARMRVHHTTPDIYSRYLYYALDVTPYRRRPAAGSFYYCWIGCVCSDIRLYTPWFDTVSGLPTCASLPFTAATTFTRTLHAAYSGPYGSDIPVLWFGPHMDVGILLPPWFAPFAFLRAHLRTHTARDTTYHRARTLSRESAARRCYAFPCLRYTRDGLWLDRRSGPSVPFQRWFIHLRQMPLPRYRPPSYQSGWFITMDLRLSRPCGRALPSAWTFTHTYGAYATFLHPYFHRFTAFWRDDGRNTLPGPGGGVTVVTPPLPRFQDTPPPRYRGRFATLVSLDGSGWTNFLQRAAHPTPHTPHTHAPTHTPHPTTPPLLRALFGVHAHAVDQIG